MDRILNPSSDIQQFVSINNLSFTDLRYSVSTHEGVADVLQFDDDSDLDQTDVYRRLLVVDEALVGTDYRSLWNTAAAMPQHYIVPSEVSAVTNKNVKAFRIPTSARLLSKELVNSQQPKNLMGNERLAQSLGSLLGSLHKKTGGIIDFSEHIVIVDFLEEEVEPVLLVPPLKIVMGGLAEYRAAARSIPQFNQENQLAFLAAFLSMDAIHER